jgi:MFS family permease
MSIAYREILGRRNFWVIILVGLAALCPHFVATMNIASIVLSRGIDLRMAGLFLALLSASDMVGKILFGMIIDRRGNRVPLVLVSLFAALGAGLLVAAHTVFTFALAIIPLGLSGGIWTVLPSSIATEFGSRSFGRAFGLLTLVTPCSMLTVPIIARLKEVSGSYNPGLLAISAFAVLGAIVATTLRQAEPDSPTGTWLPRAATGETPIP